MTEINGVLITKEEAQEYAELKEHLELIKRYANLKWKALHREYNDADDEMKNQYLSAACACTCFGLMCESIDNAREYVREWED